VEFGYKAQVVDNADAIVLDHRGMRQARRRTPARLGDRPDHRADQAPPADRHRRPGDGEARVEDDLHGLGVRAVVIPLKGRSGKARQAHEHRRAFRRTVKWRTGSEARISTLKCQYGWDRTRLDGLNGARIWTGHGVLAHNSSRSPHRLHDHPPIGRSMSARRPRHNAASARYFRSKYAPVWGYGAVHS
jgi:IS5 family transposase